MLVWALRWQRQIARAPDTEQAAEGSSAIQHPWQRWYALVSTYDLRSSDVTNCRPLLTHQVVAGRKLLATQWFLQAASRIMSRLARARAHGAINEATPSAPSAPRLRRQILRESLLPTVELLNGRQAHLVDDGFIADYIALDWLEWNGGTLRLTITGSNVCQQLRAGTA